MIASLLDVRPRCCWNTSLLDSAFSQPDGRSNSVAVYILTSSFQILCKSTAILLYQYEENIKKLLNRNLHGVHYDTASKLYTLAIPLLYPCYPPRLSPIAYRAADVALMLRRCYYFPSNLTYSLIVYWGPHEIIVRPKGDKNFVSEWGERRQRSP